MNIQEYIESGVLEAYLLGDLSNEEIVEVEQNIAAHPEIKQELARIEMALEQYAVMLGTAPPPGTLTEVLDKIPDAAIGGDSTSTGSRNSWVLGLGALALIASALAYFFFSNAQRNQQDINELQANLQALQDDCTQKDAQIAELSGIINILSDPSTRAATMQGTELAPQAVAQVFVNENTQQVFLNPGTLPAVPVGKSYQLWGLVDGNPVDMGIFELSAEGGLQSVPFIEGAQTYAVTLEEEGGQATPDLTQLYVIGNVG